MAWVTASGWKMASSCGANSSTRTMSTAVTEREMRMATWTTRLARSNFFAPRHWATMVVAAV